MGSVLKRRRGCRSFAGVPNENALVLPWGERAHISTKATDAQWTADGRNTTTRRWQHLPDMPGCCGRCTPYTSEGGA